MTKKQFLSLKKGDLLSDRHNHIYIFIKKEKVTDTSVYGHAVYAITLYTLGATAKRPLLYGFRYPRFQ